MKNIFTSLLALFFFVAGFSQTSNPFVGKTMKISNIPTSNKAAFGVQCSGGQIHDDGIAENGYGWNASAGNPSALCQQFIPTSYPFQFSKFCIALTRLSTGGPDFTFKIIMWQSSGGVPGIIMDQTTVTATNLPIWPSISFYDFVLPGNWAMVTGSDIVFIGIQYDPVTELDIFSGADESTGTALWPCYATTASGPWTACSVLWPNCRALMYRAEGGSNVTLTVDPQNKTVSAPAGSFVVSVTSNVSWNVSESSSWFSCSPTYGSNNGSFTVNYDANSGASQRSADITVTGGGLTQIVSVTQLGSSTTSTLTGLVTDAVNGNPVPGALVSIAGLNAITDSYGDYTINNVPAGTLNAEFYANTTQGPAPLSVNFIDQSTEGTNTVTCSKSGYTTYVNDQVIIPAGQTLTLNISLSPTLGAGSMRFVLNWGADPPDLDSHLNTPVIEGQSYHVFYDNQGSATSAPYAVLDHDVTNGYGPETMTIYQMFPGIYQLYINDYTEGPVPLTASQAVVQIYDENGLLQTIQVPTSGTGTYWYVCDLDGATGQLAIKNVIQLTAPGKFKNALPVKGPKKGVQSKKNIVSWLWNFGDGSSTSTLQNPPHIYNSPGTYNVSLTIGDGTNTNTKIKTGYITVTGSSGATLTGLVTDAMNGNPVAGALVSVAGLNATTDSYGNYTINNVPAGVLTADFNANPTQGVVPLPVNFFDQSTEGVNTVTCSKTDYITYVNNQVTIPVGQTLTLNISLSPVLLAGAIRFVLNWGADPSDLDSHLNTPVIEGQSYHIYYSNPGSINSAPYAALDHDVTSGYGPETMTIYQKFTGVYQFYIYDYTGGSTPITASQAVVQVYNENGLLQTIQVPTSGTGRYWYVCDVNGANGQLTIKNLIQSSAPGKFKDAMPVKEPNGGFNSNKNIVSWAWTFGDGSNSAQQNPSHTYNLKGVYTVSLTVSDGTNSNTKTKNGYIIVGGQGVNDNTLAQRIKVYPNPVENELQIDSPEKITRVSIADLSGHRVYNKETGENKLSLNVKNLNSGVYFIFIETVSGKAIKKFTVK